MKKAWTTPAVAIVTLAADAASKAWALRALQEGVAYPFIPGLLKLSLTTNTGGAFGIGQQHKELMTILATVVCLGIIFWIARRERSADKPNQWERVGTGLIIGGAAGNILDRLVLGRVTDFLEFAFMTFPVFNVADALIDVGIGLIIINSLRSSKQEVSKEAQHPVRHE